MQLIKKEYFKSYRFSYSIFKIFKIFKIKKIQVIKYYFKILFKI